MRGRVAVGLATIGVAAAVTSGVVLLRDDPYELTLSMPTASGVFDGAEVVISGEVVGEVTDIRVTENNALMKVELDEENSPMHAGTRARISWQSVLGFRTVELLPGAEDNPTLPSGRMIDSTTERVEVDDLLAMLDNPTRQRVHRLAARLEQSLDGNEHGLRATLASAGPAVEALGEVLRAVGEDGPAIRDLVTRLHAVTSELAAHDAEVAATVQDLGELTAGAAGNERSLRQALAELPSTLDAARTTLDDVPGAVGAVEPLLNDLQPATSRLPAVAADLDPVLRELRPTVADLRPMLASATTLLQQTPSLLDTAHAVLPGTTETVSRLQPATEFLRPYTPELVGWLSNWASLFGNQTSGNYGRALIVEGASSFNGNPGARPPGISQSERPLPGAIVGQPWTDAYGDGVR